MPKPKQPKYFDIVSQEQQELTADQILYLVKLSDHSFRIGVANNQNELNQLKQDPETRAKEYWQLDTAKVLAKVAKDPAAYNKIFPKDDETNKAQLTRSPITLNDVKQYLDFDFTKTKSIKFGQSPHTPSHGAARHNNWQSRDYNDWFFQRFANVEHQPAFYSLFSSANSIFEFESPPIIRMNPAIPSFFLTTPSPLLQVFSLLNQQFNHGNRESHSRTNHRTAMDPRRSSSIYSAPRTIISNICSYFPPRQNRPEYILMQTNSQRRTEQMLYNMVNKRMLMLNLVIGLQEARDQLLADINYRRP